MLQLSTPGLRYDDGYEVCDMIVGCPWSRWESNWCSERV